MADWFIATEGVKVVKDSASLWPQILTAGAAFGGVWFGQWLISRREENAKAAKREEERLYLATELVFLLEQFAEGCARVATDIGHTDAQGYTRSNETKPDIDLTAVTGDWRVLPARLMYAIREIPVLQKGADRLISATEEHDDPPDDSKTQRERHYQYARLGIRAVIQARRLRKNANLPKTRLDATEWSAQPVLWKVWRQQRKWRAQWSILNKRQLATFHIVNQMRAGKNNSGSTGEPS